MTKSRSDFQVANNKKEVIKVKGFLLTELESRDIIALKYGK
jgi:hypothetical protein